jgi:hypothetical protein
VGIITVSVPAAVLKHRSLKNSEYVRKLVTIFILGAVAGPLYDWIHVAFGVLTYEHPHFAGSSLWVPLEFGVAALLGGVAAAPLEHWTPPPVVSTRRLIFDAAMLLVAYVATGLLSGQNEVTLLVLVALAAVAVGSRWSTFVFITAVGGAIVGPLGEIFFAGIGLFHYNVANPIPYWLPVLWVIASGLFVDVTLLLKL